MIKPQVKSVLGVYLVNETDKGIKSKKKVRNHWFQRHFWFSRNLNTCVWYEIYHLFKSNVLNKLQHQILNFFFVFTNDLMQNLNPIITRDVFVNCSKKIILVTKNFFLELHPHTRADYKFSTELI